MAVAVAAEVNDHFAAITKASIGLAVRGIATDDHIAVIAISGLRRSGEDHAPLRIHLRGRDILHRGPRLRSTIAVAVVEVAGARGRGRTLRADQSLLRSLGEV